MAKRIIYEIYPIKLNFSRYSDKPNQGKIRPILVHWTKQYVNLWKITSKFNNKSKYYQKRYYPIVYWDTYNLKKPSYVDISSRVKVLINVYLHDNLSEKEPIGYFNNYDIKHFNYKREILKHLIF